MEALTQSFNRTVDITMQKLREYRIPKASRMDTQTAAEIIGKVSEEKRKMEEKLMQVLQEDGKQRWLAGDERLREILKEASVAVYGDALKESDEEGFDYPEFWGLD